MAHFKIRKGNFFNQLTNDFDYKMIDGNQYDLEVSKNNQKHYYRVRFIDGAFDARKIKLNSEEFISPKIQNCCGINEISSFLKTDFFRHEFEFRKIFEIEKRRLNRYSSYSVPDYYSFLTKSLKKNIDAKSLYDFVIPANERRKKFGVMSYKVEVECTNDYYYLVFLNEMVERGFNQSDIDLYSIYKQKDYLDRQEELNKTIKNSSLETVLPKPLVCLIYLVSDNNPTIIKSLYQAILKAREVKNLNILLKNPYYHLLLPCLKYDKMLEKELVLFISGNKDEINYAFKRKRVL